MAEMDTTYHGPDGIGHLSGNMFWAFIGALQIGLNGPMLIKGVTQVTPTRRPDEERRVARIMRNVHKKRSDKKDTAWVDPPLGGPNLNSTLWETHARGMGPRGISGHLDHIPYNHSAWRAYYHKELKRRDWEEMYAGNDPVYPSHV